MRNLRYYAEFANFKGKKWRVEIHQEGTWVPSEIKLHADTVQIEWSADDKFTPVIGSRATVTLWSQSDRQFLDLYTTDPLAVGLVVKELDDDWDLIRTYWQGLLDPEVYEEPFTRTESYPVSLSFTDFAPLDRLNYSLSGFVNVENYIKLCIETKLGYNIVNIQDYCTTLIEGEPAIDAYVLSDNFYDEEGEPMTMKEVLEEILRPIGASLIQKAGMFYLYDPNYMAGATASSIEIKGTDGSISADRVYNNVEINYSPYETNTIVDAELTTKDVDSMSTVTDEVKEKPSANAEDIKLWVASDTSSDKIDIVSNYNFYATENQVTGNRETGLMMFGQRHSYPDPEAPFQTVNGVTGQIIEMHERSGQKFTGFTTPDRVYLSSSDLTINGTNPRIDPRPENASYVRITAEVLASMLYNPFGNNEEENRDIDADEEYNTGTHSNKAQFLYLPVRVRMRNSSGNVIAHVVSRDFEWTAGDYLDDTDWSVLLYNADAGKSVFNSWRECEFRTLSPDYSGWVEVEVADCVGLYGTGRNGATVPIEEYAEILKKCNWIMVKDLKISIVDKFNNDIDVEDIELNGEINTEAKEEYSVDTIIGCATNPTHTAKGSYFVGTDYAINFARESRTSTVEDLLIGSVYSNYATRNTVFTGQCDIIDWFSPLSVPYLSGKFVPLEETQSLSTNRSEVTLVEVKQDNYEIENYE